jgi:adenosylcobinamide-GDP ribazoletransferase
VRGLALALSWLTVLPVPVLPGGGPPQRPVAAAAIRWAPVVGAVLGAAAGGVLLALAAVGVPALVAGLLTVGFLALATRGMHVDGLADTADGLGCYGPPERALAVLRDGAAGPFAVVTVVVVVGAQAGALAGLAGLVAERGVIAVLAAVALAAALGRAGFAWCCRRGVPAARPEGLGAMVAGSQPWWVAPAWWAALGGGGLAVVPGRPWQGVLAVGLGALVVVGLSWHTARRFGGMSGDVLGAACEAGVTTALVVLAAS